MELYKCLLEAIQALVDKISQPPNPEPENGDIGSKIEERNQERPMSIPTMEMEVPSVVVTLLEDSRRYPTAHVPEVEDEHVKKLWEELKQDKIKAQSIQKPPLEELDFDPKTLVLELRLGQVDVGSKYALESKKGTLRTLPSFQGEYEEKSKAKKLPSHRYGPTKFWM